MKNIHTSETRKKLLQSINYHGEDQRALELKIGNSWEVGMEMESLVVETDEWFDEEDEEESAMGSGGHSSKKRWTVVFW